MFIRDFASWLKKGGNRCVESDTTEAGIGMRDGMLAADTARVVPSSNMMRYCGDDVESKGMSITVAARLCPEEGSMARTLVPGGKGLLIVGGPSQWSETNRPPLYLIVGYTEGGSR